MGNGKIQNFSVNLNIINYNFSLRLYTFPLSLINNSKTSLYIDKFYLIS